METHMYRLFHFLTWIALGAVRVARHLLASALNALQQMADRMHGN
jgi:hypothetical protein